METRTQKVVLVMIQMIRTPMHQVGMIALMILITTIGAIDLITDTADMIPFRI
jgi:hypothetical protein